MFFASTTFWWQVLYILHLFSLAVVIGLNVYWLICIVGAIRRRWLVANEPKCPRQPLARAISAGPDPKMQDSAYGKPLPCVSIITPVKSTTSKSATPKINIHTQLFHEYNGRIENIYVFESEDDPAVPIIRKWQEEYKGQKDIRIVIAGLASTCSQKIHNMLAGVDAASPQSKYVYFLDNNTRIVRTILNNLVRRHENTTDCLSVGGTPLDIAPKAGTPPAWMIAHFRYIIHSFVNVALNASYGWGGSMCVKREHVITGPDKYRLRELWSNGGMSDDMTLDSCAIEHGLYAANVPQGVFYNELDPGISLSFAFRFMHRQLFVAACYHSWGTYLRHQAMLYSWTILNGFACINHAMFVFSLLSISGIFGSAYAEQYPYVGTVAAASISAVLLQCFLEGHWVGVMGSIYTLATKDDPMRAKFPFDRVSPGQTLWIMYTFIATNWVGTWCGIYTMFHLSTLEWGNIQYKMKNGRITKIKHGINKTT